MFPFTGLILVVPEIGLEMMETDAGSGLHVCTDIQASLRKVFISTGVLIEVLTRSIFAVINLVGRLSFFTVTTSVDLGQLDIAGSTHTGISSV